MSQYEGATIAMLYTVMIANGVKEVTITVEQMRAMPRVGLIDISYDHTTQTYKARDVSEISTIKLKRGDVKDE